MEDRWGAAELPAPRVPAGSFPGSHGHHRLAPSAISAIAGSMADIAGSARATTPLAFLSTTRPPSLGVRAEVPDEPEPESGRRHLSAAYARRIVGGCAAIAGPTNAWVIRGPVSRTGERGANRHPPRSECGRGGGDARPVGGGGRGRRARHREIVARLCRTVAPGSTMRPLTSEIPAGAWDAHPPKSLMKPIPDIARPFVGRVPRCARATGTAETGAVDGGATMTVLRPRKFEGGPCGCDLWLSS